MAIEERFPPFFFSYLFDLGTLRTGSHIERLNAPNSVRLELMSQLERIQPVQYALIGQESVTPRGRAEPTRHGNCLQPAMTGADEDAQLLILYKMCLKLLGVPPS